MNLVCTANQHTLARTPRNSHLGNLNQTSIQDALNAIWRGVLIRCDQVQVEFLRPGDHEVLWRLGLPRIAQQAAMSFDLRLGDAPYRFELSLPPDLVLILNMYYTRIDAIGQRDSWVGRSALLYPN